MWSPPPRRTQRRYHFDVNPGTYSVTVVAPAGYVPTAANQGGDTGKDSNIDAAGKMAPVTLAPGETNLSLDAGLYRTAELGDRVWFDTNKNGVQDAGEASAAGVKVTLLDASGNAVGSPLLTDANGNYLFTNLKPGAYSVQFDKPPCQRLRLHGPDQGGDDQRARRECRRPHGAVLLASGDSNHRWTPALSPCQPLWATGSGKHNIMACRMRAKRAWSASPCS